MKASKIEILGEKRIKIEFPCDPEATTLINRISGAKWSRSLKAWHIPYRKPEFEQLKKMFPELEYPNKPLLGVADGSEKIKAGNTLQRQENQNKNVSVQVIGRSIIIKLPKNTVDVHFIISLRFSRWDGKQYCWIVPDYPGNLDLIREYFNGRIYELIIHEDFDVKAGSGSHRKIKTNEILIIKTANGRLKLIFTFNNELSNVIRKMPFNNWDRKNKWWTIPYSEKLLYDIKTTAIAQKLEILYEEESPGEAGVKRISPLDISNYRTCPDEYLLKLKELRYSPKTIKTYKGLFEEFINYYHHLDIQSIDDKSIIEFLQYLVIDRKISTSYQNQSINAIKFYYERVCGGQRKKYLIERPIREKSLPNVLNETEMIKTINLIKNIKHKAIIMLIYSSGLRLSELRNLKIKDIDSKRMQVFVRQAKGRKDRYTLLSKKILPVLRQYFEEYKPREWLFEGVNGKQYSESSIQTIASEAFKRAGIKKKVSTHTLRHCFATHLLENGTDLRYIQVLMGHSSSKTTEIYTHMTTKGFDQIINPLDKLDF